MASPSEWTDHEESEVSIYDGNPTCKTENAHLIPKVHSDAELDYSCLLAVHPSTEHGSDRASKTHLGGSGTPVGDHSKEVLDSNADSRVAGSPHCHGHPD